MENIHFHTDMKEYKVSRALKQFKLSSPTQGASSVDGGLTCTILTSITTHNSSSNPVLHYFPDFLTKHRSNRRQDRCKCQNKYVGRGNGQTRGREKKMSYGKLHFFQNLLLYYSHKNTERLSQGLWTVLTSAGRCTKRKTA